MRTWQVVVAAVVLSAGIVVPAEAAADRCGERLSDWQNDGVSAQYTGVDTVSGGRVTVELKNDRATTTTADPWLDTTNASAHSGGVWNNRHTVLWSANDSFAYWLRNPRCANGGTEVTSATLFAQNDFEQTLVEAGVTRK